MTDESSTRRSARRGERTPRRKRRRWPWIVVSAVILLSAVGVVVTLLGTKALTVKEELEAARPLLESVKDKVLAGDAAQAQSDVDALVGHVARAEDATTDPLWRLGESVPVVGNNLKAVREITSAVSGVVNGAVVPAVALGDTLSPTAFKPVDGAVDLEAIARVVPVLEQAGDALSDAKKSVDGIDTEGLVEPVGQAVTEIKSLVDQVEPAMASAKQIAPVLSGLLGADGPVNYLLVFENSAEVRPLGGIAGAQILITADHGRVAITDQTSGRDFEFESEDFANTMVGTPNRNLFLVPFGRQSQNNTLTPRVDLAADLTRSMWERQRGVTADTVVFVDPVALSYVLEATGPITTPAGVELSSSTAIDLLMNQVYQMYDLKPGEDQGYTDAPDEQDAFFNGVASATFGAVMNGNIDLPKFVSAIQKAGAERRIVASSSNPAIESLIAEAGLQGGLPAQSDTSHGVGVFFSDYLGSKMEYYLRASIAVGQQTCSDGTRRIRVQANATNTVDPAVVDDLSIYITGNDANNFGVQIGGLRLFSYVYAPPGSSIVSISGSTTQSESFSGTDQEYPVARGVLTVAPGATETVTVDIDVTALPQKDVQTMVGPMLFQPDVTTLEFTC